MAEPFMSPRSLAYATGERIPYMARPSVEGPSGLAIGTVPEAAATQTPQSRNGFGGFLQAVDRFAGALAPIAEAAAAFQQARSGRVPLPARGGSGPAMSGQLFMLKVLEDMRERNEREAEMARSDREKARRDSAAQAIVLEGVKAGKIPYEDALKMLQRGIGEEPVITTEPSTQNPM